MSVAALRHETSAYVSFPLYLFLILLFFVSTTYGTNLPCSVGFSDARVCHVTNDTRDLTSQTVFIASNHPNYVEKLEVKHIKLGQIPSTIFHTFRNLRKIVMKGCSIRSLDGLRNAHNLIELKVVDNQINLVDQHAFSDALNLQVINLASNQISQIHQDAFKPLRNNPLEIDLSFNKLYNLHQNQFKFSGSNIVRVNLRGNLLDEVEFVFNELGRLKNLNLGHNKIQKISRASFYRCDSLLELHLDHNQIESVDPEAFVTNTHLAVLDLSHNNIQKLELKIASKAMGRISINNNEIGNDLLLTSHLVSTQISLLNADSNQIRRIKLLGNFFVTSLSLRHCGLNDLSWVTKFEQLTRLDISHNNLEGMNLTAIGELKTLGNLNVSHCEVGNDELKPILTQKTGLAALDVSYNPVFISYWPWIAELHSLRWLYLNGIGTDYLNPYELHQVAPNLKYLQLHDNKFNCDVFQNLRDRFERIGVEVKPDNCK